MSHDVPLILSVFFLGSACGGLLVSLRLTRLVHQVAENSQGSELALRSTDCSTRKGTGHVGKEEASAETDHESGRVCE